MSEHDPLCFAMGGTPRGDRGCSCDLIAKVAGRERERIAQAVNAMPSVMDGGVELVVLRDVLDLIARNGGRDE